MSKRKIINPQSEPPEVDAISAILADAVAQAPDVLEPEPPPDVLEPEPPYVAPFIPVQPGDVIVGVGADAHDAVAEVTDDGGDALTAAAEGGLEASADTALTGARTRQALDTEDGAEIEADVPDGAPLSNAERELLLQLEQLADDGYKTTETALEQQAKGLVQFARSVARIKRQKLYRETGTWAQYCDVRFEMTARRIDQIIAGARVIGGLLDQGIVITEAQARPFLEGGIANDTASVVEIWRACQHRFATIPAASRFRR